MAVLRKAVARGPVQRLWGAAQKASDRPATGCPICNRPMREVAVRVDHGRLRLDVCVRCQFVWFDPHEYDQLPAAPAEPAEKPSRALPLPAREAIAMAQLRLDQQRRRGGDFGAEPPDETWKTIPALLGLPVEYDENPVRSWPWVTWALVAVMAATYLATFGNLEQVVQAYGLVPAKPWRHGGLTFLTSFFLHGGWFHLLGNAYFLLVFGDNVEDQLGRWRYALLILAAALAGDLLHIMGDPRAATPCIGASGGISGLIVFYALRFPHARLGLIVRYWVSFRWFYMPAWIALVLWLLLQGLMAYSQLAGLSNVSALAHLGGASVGIVAWAWWRAGAERAREDAGDSGP